MKGDQMRVAVLTGAGVSAESGIDTFRSDNGIWSRYAIEEVATPQAFARDPQLVHEFYNMRRAGLNKVEPNAAHEALVRLEQGLVQHGNEFLLITQNVDDLHDRAGSECLLHMHGELRKIRCIACGSVIAYEQDLSGEDVCTVCDAPASLRPHIVWFGEMPFEMEAIEQFLSGCDLFVSIGTSGAVYPAAGFAMLAKEAGAKIVELNLEPSQNAWVFDDGQYGPATQIVPAYVERLLANF